MAASTGRTPEIRKDVVFNKWVIFSPARARRPSDFKSHSPVNPNPQTSYSSSCPFCAGNERDCAPEIFRIPDSSSSDWKVRVIQNLYPALKRPEHHIPDPSPNSNPLVLSGIGFHEVVIETPNHSLRLSDLSPPEIGAVLLACKKRIQQLDDGSVNYVQAIDLGRLLKIMLLKLSQQLNDPPFNFMIHTCPFQVTAAQLSCAHWFLQIVPKLGVIGGFEIGSGCFINPVFPEDAAKVLREVHITM